MKGDDAMDIAKTSTPSRLKIEKLVLKPLLYGMIFGVGYYLGTILIKSPIMTDFVEVGR